MIIRQAFLGTCRFADFAGQLNIPRATLTQRLDQLVADELLRRSEYQSNPPRHEYHLTEKGTSLWNVLAVMWQWGTEWAWPGGETPPLQITDRETGALVTPVVVDAETGKTLDALNLDIHARRRTSASA